MRIILVPTDFSKNAYNALLYATQLLKEETCTFIIMHSFEDQVSRRSSRIDIGKTEALVEEFYKSSEMQCEEVRLQIQLQENRKHTYKIIVTSLMLSRAINMLIERENVHIVVMGSKGRTAATDILMGRNTLSMISRIKKAALLIIPQETSFKKLKKIVFTTGFKRSYSKNELQPLLFVASLYQASIKIMHIHKKEKLTEIQRENFHQLFELLKLNKPESNWLWDNSNNYSGITKYLAEEQTDLLTMIYYKHNVLVRLFREATIKNIAKSTNLPFLVLPTSD